MIVFDTEATGFPRKAAEPLSSQPRLIEFAGIKLDEDMKEVGRIEFLCNESACPLPPRIVEITGITDETLKGAQDFAFHYEPLCEFLLGERTWVAHNISFDLSIVRYELERLERLLQFPFPPHALCSMRATAHLNEGRNMKMEHLHEKLFTIPFKTKHRAMADVEALTEIVRELRKREIV